MDARVARWFGRRLPSTEESREDLYHSGTAVGRAVSEGPRRHRARGQDVWRKSRDAHRGGPYHQAYGVLAEERFMLAVTRPWSSPVIELVAERERGGLLLVTRTRAGTQEILDTSSRSGASGRFFRG